MPEKKIESFIREVLTGDAQKNALELITHLTINEMQFERAKNGYWQNKPYWLIKYNDEYVCFIFIHGFPAKYIGEPEGWIIWTDDCNSEWYSNAPIDEHMKKIAWTNVDICANCNPSNPCAGGRRKIVFGKEFKHVCRTTMRFDNPDAKTVECLKMLISLRKKDILEYNKHK